MSVENFPEPWQKKLADSSFELEPATADTLGGVKIGEGISVTEDGTISAAEGGSDYDLVLMAPLHSLTVANTTVVSGDILACEQKIADGEQVNAIMLVTDEWSVTPSDANSPVVIFIAKLTYWHCPYHFMSFSATTGVGLASSELFVHVFNVQYDPDDGSITNINHPYMMNA